MPETIEIDKAAAIIQYLSLSHDRWQVAHAIAASHTWLFRGQGDARWHLVPSSLRHVKRSDMVHSLPLPWQALANEFSAVQGFLNFADELGLTHVRPSESGVFYKHLKSHSEGTCDNAPELTESLLDAFALAQHHGIKTRLLDWTAAPLAALFFSAKDAFEAEDDRTEFAVWACPKFHSSDRRIKVVRPSLTGNAFARNQRCYMMYDKDADLHYDPDSGWPTHDAVLVKQHKDAGGNFPGLRKIIIPKSESGEVLSLLFQEGYSLAHLMPTLDNVVKTMAFGHKLHPLKRIRISKLINIRD